MACTIRGIGQSIYIHALREEGDRTSRYLYSRFGTFLSTPSARRATRPRWRRGSFCRNFYPRPPRGGRLGDYFGLPTGIKISIHALREEGDRNVTGQPSADSYFYPRPPRGGRQLNSTTTDRCNAFLSTPSARRATFSISDYPFSSKISIHALREEGDFRRAACFCLICISIHALREEGDQRNTHGH